MSPADRARHVVATTRGPVEHIDDGVGPPLLVLHGTPGGCDQAAAAARLLDIEARVVAPSRPGYLRTPLTCGGSPADAADTMAALLDRLEIDRASVLGVSGGGMTAVHLAARHPDRVARLALWEAVTGPARIAVQPLLRGPLSRRTVGRAVAIGVLAVPRTVLGRAVDDPAALAALRAVVTSTFPMEGRHAGTRNDAEQATRFDPGVLRRVAAPTLLVHGDADRSVDHAHSVRAASSIEGARLVTVPRGDHLTTLFDARARDELARFLSGGTWSDEPTNPAVLPARAHRRRDDADDIRKSLQH